MNEEEQYYQDQATQPFPWDIPKEDEVTLIEKATEIKPFRLDDDKRITEGHVDEKVIRGMGGMLSAHTAMASYGKHTEKSRVLGARLLTIQCFRDLKKKGWAFNQQDARDLLGARNLVSSKITLGRKEKGENIFDKIKSTYVEQRQEIMHGELKKGKMRGQ